MRNEHIISSLEPFVDIAHTHRKLGHGFFFENQRLSMVVSRVCFRCKFLHVNQREFFRPTFFVFVMKPLRTPEQCCSAFRSSVRVVKTLSSFVRTTSHLSPNKQQHACEVLGFHGVHFSFRDIFVP
jgi:hypothetical protein